MGDRAAGGQRVCIVRTGSANVASVEAALRRLGLEPVVTESAGAVIRAERVVLPGVGSFGAAMRRLDALGLAEPLRARVDADRPTLCVCLGMQILFEASAESPEARGLGVVPGRAERFREAAGLRVPQMGWNDVVPDAGGAGVPAGVAYFANSYRVTAAPEGWCCGWSEHGERFLASIEKRSARGSIVACQFHPELSGAFGSEILSRWRDASAGGAGGG